MMWIVEIESGVWLDGSVGDPGRTLVRESAMLFSDYTRAEAALADARKFRKFPHARIVLDGDATRMMRLAKHNQAWRYVHENGQISRAYESKAHAIVAFENGAIEWLEGAFAIVERLRFERQKHKPGSYAHQTICACVAIAATEYERELTRMCGDGMLAEATRAEAGDLEGYNRNERTQKASG